MLCDLEQHLSYDIGNGLKQLQWQYFKILTHLQKCLTLISNHFRYLTRLGAGLSPHLGHSGLNVVMHTDRTTRPPENIQARPVMIPGRPS